MNVPLARLSGNPAHRSFFLARLERLAAGKPLDVWLVEEANVRGHLGAVGVDVPERPPTPGLTDEALVVAVLMPHLPVDGRLFKLVVRILQKAPLSARTLWFEARRERADRVLYWLLHQVPAEERTGVIPELLAAQRDPPRGYRGLRYTYDPSRLLRRVATKESVWRAARR